MLNIFKKKSVASSEPESSNENQNWFKRLSLGLNKTRHKLSEQVTALFLGKKKIDAELLESLQTILLTADFGVATSESLIAELTKKAQRDELKDSEALFDLLQFELKQLLRIRQKIINTDTHNPYIILMIGINGAGKTTTIGKLAHHFQNQGKKVMLAAGDTFRAAAVEQLKSWGQQNNSEVISQNTGADSASVIYDAIQSAKAKKVDILLADTAGRLHNKNNLMEELKKIKRVMAKADAQAPHEVMLVLDASIGQNAINQVKEFHEAVGITSLVLTKLDGSAKGGIIFAIAKQFNIPFAFIGVGEQIDDLQPFNAEEFVEALFKKDSH